GTLNEKDPIRFPVAKARPWAIQAAELAPEDVALRVTALRYLIEDGDYPRAIALGSSGTDDPKIGTYVGIALARSGKLDEAAQLRRSWVDKVAVHPAASELAMVELSLGQSMRPGSGRTERLEAAEKLFLDLRNISRDDPHQELRLAQVYCWLGKDQEGAEIF